jgi:hypothetical protein
LLRQQNWVVAGFTSRSVADAGVIRVAATLPVRRVCERSVKRDRESEPVAAVAPSLAGDCVSVNFPADDPCR